MSTPSGTTQDLETALAVARAENTRLLNRCNAITTEQATLGYTLAEPSGGPPCRPNGGPRSPLPKTRCAWP